MHQEKAAAAPAPDPVLTIRQNHDTGSVHTRKHLPANLTGPLPGAGHAGLRATLLHSSECARTSGHPYQDDGAGRPIQQVGQSGSGSAW